MVTNKATISPKTQFWNLPGSLENWTTGIERRVWGMKEKYVNTWQRLSIGDVLFFYVASPVGGIVGYGSVQAKFKSETPLWPDEIRSGKVIYPYCFEFDVSMSLDSKKWKQQRIPVKDLGLVIQSIGRVPAYSASKLLGRIRSEWKVSEPAVRPEAPEAEQSRHDRAKEVLLDIGRLRGFICAGEYRIDSERLDVVWKRVEKSVPTYAFEVQVGGDIYHAIGKLKHAFDIWNSRIFLVITRDSFSKVSELLAGTFHEISRQLAVVQLEKLERLQEALASVHQLERELGLGSTIDAS